MYFIPLLEITGKRLVRHDKTLPVISTTLGYRSWVRTGGSTRGDVGVGIIVDACCTDREVLVDCRFFGAVLIMPFALLMESGRNFRTESAVRPGQVAKELLFMAFV